jgi:hypothetical protein
MTHGILPQKRGLRYLTEGGKGVTASHQAERALLIIASTFYFVVSQFGLKSGQRK